MNAARGQGRLDALAGRGVVSHERVEALSDFVESTGVTRLIEKWRIEDGHTPSGPKHEVSDHAVLTLMQLLVSEYNAFSILEAADLVRNRFDDKSLAHLGLTKPAGQKVWESRIRRALTRVTHTIDPFIGNKHVRLTIEDAKREHDRRKAHPLHAVKQERIDQFSDCLTFGFIDWAIPQDVQAAYGGNFVIDGTSMPIVGKWAAPLPKKDSAAVDVDAAWWVRNGNHRHDGIDAPNDGGSARFGKSKFGYEADLLMWATNNPTEPANFPLICPVVRLKRPGHLTGELALDMVRSVAAHGQPTKLLISDMAIAPGSAPAKLQEPVFDMGVDLCIHIDIAKLGKIVNGHEGLIWVDGNPYCEAMPAGLVSATLDQREGRITREVMYRRLIQRQRYLAKPNGRPNAKGAVQYLHPTERGQHVCNPAREGAQKFCRQRSIQVPREHLELKYRQKFNYLSPEWAQMHWAARSSIEGFNGQLKNRKRTAADEPTRVPVRGYAAKYVATTMMVISANARIVKQFEARTAESMADAAKRRSTRRAGTLSETYHNAQYWVDLAIEVGGRDPFTDDDDFESEPNGE